MPRRAKKPKVKHIDVDLVGSPDEEATAQRGRQPSEPERQRPEAGEKSGRFGLFRRAGASSRRAPRTIRIDEAGAPVEESTGGRPAAERERRPALDGTEAEGRTTLEELKERGSPQVDNPLEGGGGVGERVGRLGDALREPLQRVGEVPRNLLDALRSSGERFKDGPRNLLDTLRSSPAMWIAMAVAAVGVAGFVGFQVGASDRASIRSGLEDLELPTIQSGAGVAAPGGQTSVASEDFLWPVQEIGRVSSCFGPRTLFGAFSNHQGLDIAVPSGTPVVASLSGTVVRARVSTGSVGYGTVVVLAHDDGTFTLYAHMLPQLSLAVGQMLQQGAVLGSSGNTGFSTGPHLHFEVIDPSGTSQNPARYLSRRWLDAGIFNNSDAKCWPDDIIGSAD